MRRRQLNGWITTLAAAVAMVALFGVLPLTMPAQAATLMNQDATAHQIEVIFKSSRRAYELAPGKLLTDFCAQGCIIRLNGSADLDFALEGTERVSIEGGLVYYDGEETKRDATRNPNGESQR